MRICIHTHRHTHKTIAPSPQFRPAATAGLKTQHTNHASTGTPVHRPSPQVLVHRNAVLTSRSLYAGTPSSLKPSVNSRCSSLMVTPFPTSPGARFSRLPPAMPENSNAICFRHAASETGQFPSRFLKQLRERTEVLSFIATSAQRRQRKTQQRVCVNVQPRSKAGQGT